MVGSSQYLKQSFIEQLGPQAWNESWQTIAHLDPEIFSASIKLMAVPREKNHLGAKMQAFVQLAVDCAATHLYTPGIRRHVRAAAEAGASLGEVMEVLELTSTLGIHAFNIGVPLLVEAMQEEGVYESHAKASKPLDVRRQRMKQAFIDRRGYWNESLWEMCLKLDPELFQAYTDFSSVPWDNTKETGQGLPPAEKELIYCAFDAAATHLYVSGLKAHMKNALKYGATPEQILEVLELATPLSLHTLNVATPIVQEEFDLGRGIQPSRS